MASVPLGVNEFRYPLCVSRSLHPNTGVALSTATPTHTNNTHKEHSVVCSLFSFFLPYPFMEPLPRASEQEQCGATKFLPSAFRSFLYQTVAVHPQSHLKGRKRKRRTNKSFLKVRSDAEMNKSWMDGYMYMYLRCCVVFRVIVCTCTYVVVWFSGLVCVHVPTLLCGFQG